MIKLTWTKQPVDRSNSQFNVFLNFVNVLINPKAKKLRTFA